MICGWEADQVLVVVAAWVHALQAEVRLDTDVSLKKAARVVLAVHLHSVVDPKVVACSRGPSPGCRDQGHFGS